jgi:hypothetical protein
MSWIRKARKMNRKFYAVYTKLAYTPQAIFSSLSWAERFIEEQQKIWVNAKFHVEEVDSLLIRGKLVKPRGKIRQALTDLLGEK